MSKNNAVVLEGFHVCKHAIRFGANITELVTHNKIELEKILTNIAPDVTDSVLSKVQEISDTEFSDYSDIQIRTPLAGKAKIPKQTIAENERKPLVYLENPRDLENIGAVVRLAAGMDCSGVVTSGDVDPWHKNCLRGSRGLHFALPVLHVDQVNGRSLYERQKVVFDESGVNLTDVQIADNALLVFGSERQGVGEQWLKEADVVVRIPQRGGVSSYNLATSVAMGLYHVQSRQYD